MPKEHRPRHGSMGFSPRKRSDSPIPHFTSWPDVDGAPKVQGFAGYKAGMTHAVIVDYRPTSTTSGQEVHVPVTVVEVPPMKVGGIRFYRRTHDGLKSVAEVWAPKPDKELRRVFPISKDYDPEEAWKKVDGQVDDVRLITYTQPALVTGVPKTKPELMENRVGGGTVEERIAYAKNLLGKEVPVTEFCREGSMIDVAAITKGKGWQGHHTRWGVRLLSHKNSKHRRNIGTLGNFNPGYVRPTVPQGGQFGYHQRTEYNKRVLKIGEKGDEITPNGGFLHYGLVRNPYILLHGSIPGPTKRLIRLRDAARGGYVKLDKSPEITYVSRESKQGA
uniref:Large ribosomal subunit protein uL3 n=1 Tax=uncultured euryarchaeote Rifle_16ft_4_minimus_23719 TaxID=1665190 RepID=A0A0H4T209_9EURY|nr:50S ribosomal protein L3P [uncultured euryarchaeote Rifle_16ft_4_minimus_23719]